MSVSLYRKYRPALFEDIIGQEHVARTLVNAIKHDRVSHAYLAVDVARFMPVSEFTARVAAYCRMMRETPPAPGFDEVLVAGDPEKRIEAERRSGGVPVPEGNWEELVEAARRLGVAPPC